MTDFMVSAIPVDTILLLPIQYDKFDNPDRFYSTDKCVTCKKCANLCPLNNIKLVKGKPQWGANSTPCMACICGCPYSELLEEQYGQHHY